MKYTKRAAKIPDEVEIDEPVLHNEDQVANGEQERRQLKRLRVELFR